MTEELAQKAIQAALSGNWPEAVKLNEEILKVNPKDLAALNRLGRAHFQEGNLPVAKKTFKVVLAIDPFNPIALKSLKLQNAPDKKKGTKGKLLPLQSLFLEEPGRTNTLSITNLGEKGVISRLSPGEEAKILPRQKSISIQTQDGQYLGKLPDDVSYRLLRFLRGGSRYQVFIKSANPKEVKVFIKEIFRAARFANQPSFSLPRKNSSYKASVSPGTGHLDPVIMDETGEND